MTAQLRTLPLRLLNPALQGHNKSAQGNACSTGKSERSQRTGTINDSRTCALIAVLRSAPCGARPRRAARP